MLKNLTAVCVLMLNLMHGSAVASILFTDDPVSGEPAAPAKAARLALVVGNSDYATQALVTPSNDAHILAGLLRKAGFEVTQLENATHSEVNAALGLMRDRLEATGTGLFYFAGHGVQTRGSTFLLPIDADTSSADAITDTGVELDFIVQQLSDGRSGGRNIVILDACLNNPFNRSTDHGAQSVNTSAITELPANTLLGFATQPGEVSYDGPGAHGVYTQALIDTLQHVGRLSDDSLKRVRATVMQRTGARQTPWHVSTLPGALQLTEVPATGERTAAHTHAVIPEAVLLSLRTRGILPKDGDAQYELEFWQSIKNSTDAADYEAYLEAYPNGKFAPLARSRAARYKKTVPEIKPPPVSVKAMDVEYETVRNANMREAPSPKSKRLKKINKGKKVHVTGKVVGENWYQVEVDGKTGYIFSELLREPVAAAPKPSKPKPPVKAPPPVVKAPPPVKTAPPVVVKKMEVGRDCPTCPEMVTLPAGSFTMGDDRGDRSERPAHRVSIARPFAIGVYEVTVGQWNACHQAGGCDFTPDLGGISDSTPIRDISWTDARQYVKWLSKTTGKKYRLPTEAEWEYAARAGSSSRFWWGDKAGTGHADCKNCSSRWDRKSPAEVNAYPPNAFGLHGTSGGVWEWVADCWYKSHAGAPKNGGSRTRADCREHVIRGGAWRNDASYMHSASRFKYDSNVRYILNGLRVAKTLE